VVLLSLFSGCVGAADYQGNQPKHQRKPGGVAQRLHSLFSISSLIAWLSWYTAIAYMGLRL
jgi:hypothetical protein